MGKYKVVLSDRQKRIFLKSKDPETNHLKERSKLLYPNSTNILRPVLVNPSS